MNKKVGHSHVGSIMVLIIIVIFTSLACMESTPVVQPPKDTVSTAPLQKAEIEKSSPLPNSTRMPTETPSPLPTETPKPVGSARSNPAPFGYEVTIDQMTFKIEEVVRPADDIVEKGNMFNSKAGDGKEYVLIKLSIKCNKNTDASCLASSYEFKLVGSSGQARDIEFIAGVADTLDSGEFFGGATKTGYLPYIVDKDESGLVLMYKPILGNEIYLSVEK